MKEISIFDINDLKIDKNKKSILFVTAGDLSKYSHVFGPQRWLMNYLKKDYNVIIFGTRKNQFKENYIYYNADFTNELERKKENPENYLKNNIEKINKMTENLKKLPYFDYVISENDVNFMLPLQKYTKEKPLSEWYNEYFDYVGDDKKIFEKIQKVTDKFKDIEFFVRKISPLAFSIRRKFLAMTLVRRLNDFGKIGLFIGFVQDPTYWTPFCEIFNIPSKFVYFVEDKRGTRNFEEFPIAQFQYNVYEKEFFNKKFEDYKNERNYPKTKDFLFAGTILQEKGSRIDTWEIFLKDLKSDNCEFYIPLKKGSINTIKNRKLRPFEEKNLKLIEEIKNHKSYKGEVTPDELNEKFKEFKYAICLRTVSIHDSLSFKPVNYVNVGILPFFEPEYDPEGLQIPKEIQEKLLVKNSKDIDEKIKYFNEHPEEREELVKKLQKHFKLDEFINNTDNIIEKSIKRLLNV